MNQGCEWIYYGLGMFYMKNEHFKEAANKFYKILNFNSSYAEAYVQLGLISKIEGSKKEAGRFFKKAIKEQTTCEAAHYQLGSLYLEEGRHDFAIDCFSEVLKQNPASIDAILSLVNIKILQGDFDCAWALLGKIYARNAITTDWIVKLLPCLISTEQFNMAIRLINSVSIKKQGYTGHPSIALLSSIGAVEITAAFAERLVEKWETLDDHFDVRLAKLLAKRLLGRKEWISEWEKYPEWFPVNKIGLDEALAMLQRWGAFFEAVEVGRKYDCESSSTKKILFNILFRLGRYHEALKLAAEIEYKPYLRAVILRNTGRLREAKKELEIYRDAIPSREFIYQLALMEFFDFDVNSTALISINRDDFTDFQRTILETFYAEAANDDVRLIELADLWFDKNVPIIISPLLAAALFRQRRQGEGNALLYRTLVNMPLNRLVDPFIRRILLQSSSRKCILGDQELCEKWIFTIYDSSDLSLQPQYLMMRMRHPMYPHNTVLELAHKAVQLDF